MVWVRIDDSFAQHPKVLQAGPLAMALQVAALCYCNRNLTDGFVPWAVAQTLLPWQFLEPSDDVGRRRRVTVAVTSGMSGDDVTAEYVINLLLESGMWEVEDGGYRIHDYPDFQPSREQVEKERKSTAERQERWRNGRSNAESNAVINSAPVPVPVPVPLTVVPTELQQQQKSARRRKTARPGEGLEEVRQLIAGEDFLAGVCTEMQAAFPRASPSRELIFVELRGLCNWLEANGTLNPVNSVRNCVKRVYRDAEKESNGRVQAVGVAATEDAKWAKWEAYARGE